MSKPNLNKALLLGGGALAAGALAFLVSRPGPKHIPPTPPEAPMQWWQKVILRVSQHEGGFDALNRNTDGAGLSFGMIQWAQRPGSLGELLHAMYKADPQRFQSTFGPASADLLRVTGAGSLAAVDGAVLWKEPWVGRFKAAGGDPVFQRVQFQLAKRDYLDPAIKAARTLGFVTERSAALMMDTAVQQGPGHANKVARRVRDLYAGKVIPMEVILETYARLTPAHFLRTSPPTAPHSKPHLRWVQIKEGEWHVHAGRFDLYEDVIRRRMAIVKAPDLGDVLLEASAVA